MNRSRSFVTGASPGAGEFILPWSGRGVDYTTEEDIASVVEVMRHADPLTQGKYLVNFEKVFSDYHGGMPAFATSSCAAALELAAMLIQIEPGDEVIIPAHTYVASAIPFARRGAKLVWADIDPDTRVITAEEAELVTEGTMSSAAATSSPRSARSRCSPTGSTRCVGLLRTRRCFGPARNTLC